MFLRGNREENVVRENLSVRHKNETTEHLLEKPFDEKQENERRRGRQPKDAKTKESRSRRGFNIEKRCNRRENRRETHVKRTESEDHGIQLNKSWKIERREREKISVHLMMQQKLRRAVNFVHFALMEQTWEFLLKRKTKWKKRNKGKEYSSEKREEYNRRRRKKEKRQGRRS